MTTLTKECGSESVCENGRVYQPAVDIVESESELRLIADLPGVNESTADVRLEKNVLTIRGRVTPREYEGYTRERTEYGVGSFERSFTISNNIDQENISAVVRDGVLRITLPKVQPAEPKSISIQAG